MLVDSDDSKRRLVYAIKSERLTQHSASAQVFTEADGRSRFVWIADVLPNEVAPYMDAQMDQGAAAMQKALGAQGGLMLATRSPACARGWRGAPRQNLDWRATIASSMRYDLQRAPPV